METLEAVPPVTQLPLPTSISGIARLIEREWKNVYFGARPYLSAMRELEGADSQYGMDSAKSIILYFLSNASTFRGGRAKELKAALKKIVGIK